MKVNVVFNDNKIMLGINNFLESISDFNFSVKKTQEINSLSSEIILYIICCQNKSHKNVEKILLSYNKLSTIFFLPTTMKNLFNSSQYKIIYYPMNINTFENKLIEFININEINFYPLVLNNQNLLINTITNNKIYLTETEAATLRLFFTHKIISKNKIKIEVLNLKPTIDSKSLETHLYRLRKKIHTICSEVSIFSVDEKKLKIK